jgi:DNA-binding NarL/FixJ family response regulator
MAAPIKLLVVDDHNLFRHGLVGLLSDLPDFLIVGEASNGPDAVELCRQRRPDVVLMDVHMPGGNGVEAARILKQESDVKVVMLTISDDDQDLLGALSAGADGYLLKNADLEQLRQAICQVTTGQGTLSPEVTSRVMKAAAVSHSHRPRADLSQRETEVLTHLAQGATTAEIAHILVISQNTVKTHIRRILNKLDAANRAEAVARASALGLIPPLNRKT